LDAHPSYDLSNYPDICNLFCDKIRLHRGRKKVPQTGSKIYLTWSRFNWHRHKMAMQQASSSYSHEPDLHLELPRTKLSPPAVPAYLITRPRLLDRLINEVTQRRLTLISAPAGYGKTTLLGSLCNTYPDLPIAWLTLDQDDDEAVLFTNALLSALNHLEPGITPHCLEWMQNFSGDRFAARRLMGMLVNDLLEGPLNSLILVFDDFHRISNPEILEALDYLLEFCPPSLHLIISTRHEPALHLARMRSLNQVAEFHLSDMQFTEAEITLLLNHRLNFNLSVEEVRSIRTQTEGWAACLRLLASSLEGIPDAGLRAEFIHDMGNIDRYVYDLLAEEVLSRQSSENRTFLLETSILKELTPHACKAVTQNPRARAILVELYRANLFLSSVDDQKSGDSIYRYHALFGTFLKRTLANEMPERVKELHFRAAQVQLPIEQVIEHYLAAEAWDQAADAIQSFARLHADQGYLPDTFLSWVNHIPEYVYENRPWLRLIQGIIDIQHGQFISAVKTLKITLAQFKAAGDRLGIIISLLYLIQDRRNVDMNWFDEIEGFFKSEPGLKKPLWQVNFYMSAAWAHLYHYQWDMVEKYLLAAIRTTLAENDLGSFRFMSQSITFSLLFTDSGLAPIERYARETLAKFGEGDGLIHMGIYSQLAYLSWFRGNPEEARRYARQALHISRVFGRLAWIDIAVGYVILADMLARAEYPALEKFWQEQWSWLSEADTWKARRNEFLYIRGRAMWLQGHLEEAEQICRRMADYEEYDEHRANTHMMRGMLALSRREFAGAEAEYQQALEVQHRTRMTLPGHARLGLAMVYWESSKRRAALVELETGLSEIQARGMPGLVLQEGQAIAPLLEAAVREGIFPDFASLCLARLKNNPVRQPIRISDTQETLTSREVDVLQLIAQGASNQEIANQLVISENTVKSHVTRILAKIGATSRTQAAAYARKLGLY
jgi:LuxR family maltose regulon positive regulatory protein